MIEKRTVVDQVEITATGHVQVRLALQLVEDGTVIDTKYHRTSVEPGGDVDAQIAAVNVDLAAMGKNATPGDGVQRVKDLAAVVWTTEVVQAHKDRVKDHIEKKGKK